jgi:hypothetical protein
MGRMVVARGEEKARKQFFFKKKEPKNFCF